MALPGDGRGFNLKTHQRRTLYLYPFSNGGRSPEPWVVVHWDEKVSERFADFLYKTAFLKSKFRDDPVRVERRTVSHFKDLE